MKVIIATDGSTICGTVFGEVMTDVLRGELADAIARIARTEKADP